MVVKKLAYYEVTQFTGVLFTAVVVFCYGFMFFYTLLVQKTEAIRLKGWLPYT
jgi:hypothetical protein